MQEVSYTHSKTQLTIAKRRIAIRYWLQGAGFHVALKAMDFAEGYHTGVRKDGVTPEFDHQISIAHYVRSLPDLLHPEATLATVMLHDVREDYKVSRQIIEDMFGARISDATELLNKYDENGYAKNPQGMIADMGKCPIASIVKPCDRSHNWDSMVGVFTPQKQLQYVSEGEQLIPMIKLARRRFPEQERAYENIKHVLQGQARLIREALKNHPELIEQLGEPATINPLEE